MLAAVCPDRLSRHRFHQAGAFEPGITPRAGALDRRRKSRQTLSEPESRRDPSHVVRGARTTMRFAARTLRLRQNDAAATADGHRATD